MITGSLNPPKPFGRFKLTAKIASGGMATVYRAEVEVGDPLYGKPLALKILHDHLSENPEFIRMFKDEGRIVQQFEHPNVVRVYEVGECDGAQYLAMEFVEGRDLAQLLVAHRLNRQVMTSAVAFEVLRQALTALKYIHGYKGRNGRVLGIVHRDISPQNLLISRQPQVKLTDFGIARGDHRSDRTRTGTVKGKMHYMSPEQARGVRVDARADLYALGAVAYEMLTGQPLFGPGTTEVLQARAIRGEIEFGSKFNNLAPDIQTWLRKALCRDENERFHSADAMLAAMELIPKASRALYKPEALLRLMDLPEARRSRQRDQRLFINDDESSGRLSSGAVLAPKPAAHASTLPPGNHTDLGREQRMQRLGLGNTDSRIDWNAANANAIELKPVTGVRSPNAELERARRRSQVGMLPAEAAVGKSYRPEGVVDTPSRVLPKSAPALETSGPIDVLEPSSLKRPRKPEEARPVGDKPVRAAKASGQTRMLAPEQQGLALAGVVAWACGALILFAVLLEVTGSQVHLPEVTDQSLAQLFDDDTPATRTDAVAGAKTPVAHPVPAGPAAFRAAPVLRSAGMMAPEPAAHAAAVPAGKPVAVKHAAAVEPEGVEADLKRAKAERAAERLVEQRAERLAWADKPLEKVEKPEPKGKPAAEKVEKAEKVQATAAQPIVPVPAKPAIAKPAVPAAKPAAAKPAAPAAKPAAAKPAVPAGKPAAAKPAVPAAKPAVAKPAVPAAKPAVAKPAVPAAKPAVAKPAVPGAKPAVAKPAVPGAKPAVAKPAVPAAKPAVAKPAVPAAKPAVAKPAVPAVKPAVAKPAVPAVKPAVAKPAAPAAKPAVAKPVAHPAARPAAAAKPAAAHAPAAAGKAAAPHAGPAKVGATAAHPANHPQ